MNAWIPFDLPYEVHTRRELEFMLASGKPLAHFSDIYPREPDENIIPSRAFAPHVADGTFEMRVFVEPLRRPPPPEAPHLLEIYHVLYARRQEEWRIDAFIAMLAASARSGWSEGFEWLEGYLLGYEEWQTEAHLEHLRRSPNAKDFPWLSAPRA